MLRPMQPPNFEIPENRTVLKIGFGSTRYLPTHHYSGRGDPLGVHWDFIRDFYDKVGAKVPRECKWVIWGRMCFVHPMTGIIFGFGGGTHFYALRLRVELAAEACNAGALPLDTLPDEFPIYGPEWIRPHFAPQHSEWAVVAYEYAGTIGKSDRSEG
jgi:hypothetical protein